MAEEESKKARFDKVESSTREKKEKRLYEISVPVLIAIATAVGTILGSLITANSDLRKQNLQSQAQFELERQKFEFSLIAQALEVDTSVQVTDESEGPSKATRNTQAVSTTQQDRDKVLAEQDEKDRQRAAEELLFLVDIGIIQRLDADKLRERAEDPESLPRLSSTPPGTGICFQATGPTPLYAYPSLNSQEVAEALAGDVFYATTNPNTSHWFDDGTEDGNSFIEVAIYDGFVAWVPRFQVGSDNALVVDSPIAECTEPGPNAFIYR